MVADAVREAAEIVIWIQELPDESLVPMNLCLKNIKVMPVLTALIVYELCAVTVPKLVNAGEIDISDPLKLEITRS